MSTASQSLHDQLGGSFTDEIERLLEDDTGGHIAKEYDNDPNGGVSQRDSFSSLGKFSSLFLTIMLFF